MKHLMRTFIIGAAIVLVTATAWAANITKYEQLDCSGGFRDAYLITEIDPTVGCIVAQFGIGCDGEPFHHDFIIHTRPSDLLAPFDYQYSGITAAGVQWHVKIGYNDGQFVKAWGKKADGSYYEATLQ